MLDIDKVRRDTPSCESVLHFNNAGSSLMSAPVFEALGRVLRDENELGGYEAERRAKDDIAAFYTEFAALLNAEPEEIPDVENPTRLVHGVLRARSATRRPRLHARLYASDYRALLEQSRPRRDRRRAADASGCRRRRAGRMLTPAPLIASTHVPTHGGLVNPVEEVQNHARTRDPLSSGRLPIRRPNRRRRGPDRMRHPVGDRTEVPARPARSRVPQRPQARSIWICKALHRSLSVA